MELRIRSSFKDKVIKLDKEIISLSTSDPLVFDNLKDDYDVVEIDNSNLYFAEDTVVDELASFSKYPEFGIVADLMQILDYPRKFFFRKTFNLSNTEKIFLNIFRNISNSGDIVLFKDVFLGLDSTNRKKLLSIINYLIDNNYTVIVCSSNVNVLYNISKYSIIVSDDDITYEKTDDVFSNVDLLIKNKIDIPTLSYITYKAKKDKNVKLFYSKDVRDIIKDIYKHV